MTQDSRQSLVELLFLSLYLDDHLSLAEDEVLNQALDSLGWDSEVPRERFIFTAFASARGAAADSIKTDYSSPPAPMLSNATAARPKP